MLSFREGFFFSHLLSLSSYWFPFTHVTVICARNVGVEGKGRCCSVMSNLIKWCSSYILEKNPVTLGKEYHQVVNDMLPHGIFFSTWRICIVRHVDYWVFSISWIPNIISIPHIWQTKNIATHFMAFSVYFFKILESVK